MDISWYNDGSIILAYTATVDGVWSTLKTLFPIIPNIYSVLSSANQTPTKVAVYANITESLLYQDIFRSIEHIDFGPKPSTNYN